MHLTNSFPSLVAIANAASKTTTTAKSSSGSGSSEFLLVIIVLFALLYFLLIRPNQRRRMQAMRQSRTFGVGDDVVAGGMMGRVARLGDDEVDVEVSDGVVISFVPQAVQLRSAYLASRAGRAGGGGLLGGGGGMFGAGASSAAAGTASPSSAPTGFRGASAPVEPASETNGGASSDEAFASDEDGAGDAWPSAGAGGSS